MGIHNNALIGASSQGYQISRSVRTRASASAYFNRTFTTPTLGTKWTWSGWVKRGTLGAAQTLFSGQVDVNNWGIIAFLSGDTLTFQQADAASVTSTVTTTQVFRDSSAWYHIIVVFDSTQATAANRLKMYVNGVQITAFGTATYLAQNTASRINAAVAHQLSRYISAAQYFDGYMTEVNFIDGQALTPSSFGETNAVTGVWQPKRYAGTYGTNGFYLNFSDNSGVTATTIGKDNSGNGNNWTPNNISITAGATYDSMIDVPTPYADGGNGRGNYAVLNPLSAVGGPTINDGNLKLAGTDDNGLGTIAIPSSGKWYFEGTVIANGQGVGIGIQNIDGVVGAGTLSDSDHRVYVSNGYKYAATGTAGYGATYTVNDVIGVAVNMDTGDIEFFKNNVSQGVAFTDLISTGFTWIGKVGTYNLSGTWAVNFGQQPFAYTPPTGFKALNTQNLPTPTISNGAQYMAATTYTGTGASQNISNAVNGISMQPDLIWIKRRNAVYDHDLFDAVRGAGLSLYSSSTAAEGSGEGQDSFNTNGFTVSGNHNRVNISGGTFAAWQWNAGGSTVTNTSGTISAQVRANPTAGFSVVTGTFPSTGTSCTFGHGLGVAPSMIISKGRDGGTSNWIVRHTSLGNMTTKYLEMNNTGAVGTGPNAATAPSSTIASVSTDGLNNNMAFVAYCFAAVAGYSAFGSYTGNSTDGPFVYLGFRPRFLLVKAYSSGSAERWLIWDSSRNTYNIVSLDLVPNTTATEGGALAALDFLSNGFKIRTANSSAYNFNGYSYIYAAFAENPFKNSLAR